jgi:hypothetical protein
MEGNIDGHDASVERQSELRLNMELLTGAAIFIRFASHIQEEAWGQMRAK